MQLDTGRRHAALVGSAILRSSFFALGSLHSLTVEHASGGVLMFLCLWVFLKQRAKPDAGVEGVWTRAILSNSASWLSPPKADLVGNTPDPATITYL